ncbi:MAG: SDR family NAD(P)-dependent oxidoreductase [Candidatus Niameybacter stercoravium]|nr:SDR family NAD(P)-dependent oxidoreductase [Candidatus Niameybacter stercoravium]
MKTILVTGGTSGIGEGLAMSYLENGDRVIVVGNSLINGNILYNKAKEIGTEERLFYIQADLSLVKENQRIIQEINDRFNSLDLIVFCAAKNSASYIQTQEEFELTFALSYLSRFILSYGLKECLERSENPIILNVCGSGMKGKVNWNDLQYKQNFDAKKVMFHSSRLNDLLGVQFAQNDTVGKIKYIMYNPWAVQTPGMMEVYNTPLMKLVYKLIGKPVKKAIVPIIDLLNNPPTSTLSAYRERKNLSLNIASYNPENAKKLYDITIKLLAQLNN